MTHDAYKSAKESIKRDCARTQMIQQQFPDATIVGDEVYLNIPKYPQINTSHLDIVRKYNPKQNPNLKLFWQAHNCYYRPPYFDDLIYLMCKRYVETVGIFAKKVVYTR